MKSQRAHPKAVIFDMDGVITNTMPDHYRAWKDVLQEEGVNVSHEDIYSREGQRGLQSVRELFEKYKKPFSFTKARAVLRKKEERFKKIVKTRFVPGSRPFLKRLNKKGYALALVTGTSRHEMQQILPRNLQEFFSVTVTGNEVDHGKPHPEPYKKALKQLGLRPNEAVVIENAPFGIRSAKAAGIPCLALETSLSREYLKEADNVFRNISELENSIEFNGHV